MLRAKLWILGELLKRPCNPYLETSLTRLFWEWGNPVSHWDGLCMHKLVAMVLLDQTHKKIFFLTMRFWKKGVESNRWTEKMGREVMSYKVIWLKMLYCSQRKSHSLSQLFIAILASWFLNHLWSNWSNCWGLVLVFFFMDPLFASIILVTFQSAAAISNNRIVNCDLPGWMLLQQ